MKCYYCPKEDFVMFLNYDHEYECSDCRKAVRDFLYDINNMAIHDAEVENMRREVKTI